MKKANRIDVLLVGRPDHSMMIYHALYNQKDLSFRFITFKVLPIWLKSLLGNAKIQFVKSNVLISLRASFINICKYSLGLDFAKNWSERGSLEKSFKRLTKRIHPKLIHYWFVYSNDAIERYKFNNPDVIILKDIHMPSFQFVYETMEPVAKKYNIPEIASTYIPKAQAQALEMRNVESIVAPSQFVVDTFKKYFPDKKYYIIPYGITKYCLYQKKTIKAGHRFSFVYIGRISLEKGCDLLFEFFNKHPEYTLHIYGSMTSNQSSIFNSLISENIILHGSIPKNHIQREITKHDIGIHLSRFDAYSLGVGEIIGCGLPVIISNATGNEGDVRKYNWGEVCTNSPEDIERAVTSLTTIEKYNETTKSIDEFLSMNHKPYGELMVDFYKSLINR